MRMRDRAGEVNGRPIIAVVRDGENARLRTRQPLQTRGRHTKLETSVDAGLRDLAIALDAEQAFGLGDEVFHRREAAGLFEMQRSARQRDAAEAFRSGESGDLVEQRDGLDLAIFQLEISFSGEWAVRQRRAEIRAAGEVAMREMSVASARSGAENKSHPASDFAQEGINRLVKEVQPEAPATAASDVSE